MCGRYASARKKHELLSEFEIELDGAPDQELEADYNVAPTKEVYAVLSRIPKTGGGDGAERDNGGSENGVDGGGKDRGGEDGHGLRPEAERAAGTRAHEAAGARDRESAAVTPEADAGTRAARPVRQLRVVRWGLVPSWAKDPSIGSRLINARVETLAEKPAFRRALASRRCLVPADGYFEWEKIDRKTKQPYFIRPADGGVLAMAGLYEFWKDPTRAADDPLRWLCTCTVITTTAEDQVGKIHDRMPMLIEQERWAEWLDPRITYAAGLLVPASAKHLEAYPVSPSVNDVRNNGPELIDPLENSPAETRGDGTLF
jgi:putative SOS response-associated peptidase YedK